MGATTNDTVVAVTEVVSDALEAPMEELPPLSRVVDLDAVDTLVSSNASTRPPGITVTFTYAGLTVVIQSHGMVYATPIDDGGETALNRLDFDT
jgi:hypothetical protein